MITTITFGITLPGQKPAGMFLLARPLGLLIYYYRSDDSEGKRVKCVCAFWDERYCKNRSITDVDWSPKVRPSQAGEPSTYGVEYSFRNSVSHHTTRMPQRLMSLTGLWPCGTYTCSSDQNLCSIPRCVTFLSVSFERC